MFFVESNAKFQKQKRVFIEFIKTKDEVKTFFKNLFSLNSSTV